MSELDNQLLGEFASAGSEPAFATLVLRYVNLVYSTALRSTGNTHNAEDITQAVFTILARKAETFSPRIVLSGWLYQTTRLTSANFMKGELRRRRREEEAAMESTLNEPTHAAWHEIGPLLDEAMERLGQTDRDAVMLRYFENKTAAEIGATLRMSEDTARRRVNRALEKLRGFFLKRGVISTTATIAGAISANAVQAAPVTLAKTATAVAVVKGATASTSTLTLIKGALKIMAWTKVNTAIVTAVVAASVVVPLLVQHQAEARLRDGDEILQRQAAQLAAQKTENDRLSTVVANSSLTKEQLDDLQKLRAALGPLQQQAGEVAQLQQENRQLKAKMGQASPKTPMQIKEVAVAKMSYGKNWVIGFYQYAEKHNGQFPTSFEDAAAFVPDTVKNQSNVTPDQFEIVFQGSLSSLEKPQDIIVLREKEAQNAGESSHPPGQWIKTYTFADGHSEIHHELDNNFDDYEKAHMISSPANQ